MASILIADTAQGAVSLNRILQEHERTVVNTMSEAQAQLLSRAFDLIVVSLHFDESHMFELVREVKKSAKNANKPIICFCSRDTRISRLMHESLEYSTKLLGAWMYLDEHSYNVYKDPDAELRRVMERCLTAESRKEIQQQRLNIQRRRAELQQLRKLLQRQEWSPELKEYLDGLKHDLTLLMDEVTRLQSAAQAKRASVAASRDLKDRVAEHVSLDENDMTKIEESQSVAETRQTFDEEQLATLERFKEAKVEIDGS